jgi:protein gp37
MSQKSAIEWTDATWNPVTGCTKISPGCAHCYMFREYPKLAKLGVPGYAGGTPDQVRTWNMRLGEILHWRKPRRIFVVSMGDLFHEAVPDDFIKAVLGAVRLALLRGHILLFLTKRPERMAKFANYWFGDGSNFTPYEASTRMGWGVSVENQKCADERIPVLLQMPVGAGFRWVSYEPGLGPLTLECYVPIPDDQGHCGRCGCLFEAENNAEGIHQCPPGFGPSIDCVVAGGESGPEAWPSHPDWFRAVRDQCQAAAVPFFFKQWGEWIGGEDAHALGIYDQSVPASRIHKWSDGTHSYRVGRKRAGRLLDGREWNEFPQGLKMETGK